MAASPAYTLSHDMSQLSVLLRIAAMHLHDSFSQLAWLALAHFPPLLQGLKAAFGERRLQLISHSQFSKVALKREKLIMQKACQFMKHIIVGLPNTNLNVITCSVAVLQFTRQMCLDTRDQSLMGRLRNFKT